MQDQGDVRNISVDTQDLEELYGEHLQGQVDARVEEVLAAYGIVRQDKAKLIEFAKRGKRRR